MCIHTQKMNYSIQSLIKYLNCLDCKHHSPTTTHHSAMQFITKGERSSNSCIVDAEEVLCDTYLAKPQNHRMDKIGRDHQRSSCSAVLRRRAPEKTLFRIVSRQVYKYLQRRFHSITCILCSVTPTVKKSSSSCSGPKSEYCLFHHFFSSR